MKKLKGIGASAGISVATVFVIKHEEIKVSATKVKDFNKEIKTLEKAMKETVSQIEKLKQGALKKLGEEKAAIFDAHIQIATDPAIMDGAIAKIKEEHVSAAYAIDVIGKEMKATFEAMDDHYFKERAADVADVSNRLVRNILGKENTDLSSISKEVVIVAHDLTPSETSQLNPKFVKGFVTEIGGRTSHSAIMARTLEIPAVVGVGKEVFKLTNKDSILIDGNTGEIHVNPSKAEIKDSAAKAKKLEEHKKYTLTFKNKKSVSKDGWHTEVVANIGSPADVDGVKKFGGDGVGLFRSEFLYMEASNWPTEEEQFKAYKEVLAGLNPKKVVIRTLDIGGDKKLPYFEFPYEMNPFLGYRAIRLQLDKKDIFKAQARALLRASAFGKLAINVPMIATIEEFLEVKKFFKDTETKLKKEGKKVGKYELGIMVEVPSAVELADKFAKYADFFSIGTNDLMQYTFAADRMSEKVSYLYQPYSPIILRKIKRVIDESHKAGKWTAICGELAGEPLLAPVFVGMGLDEFSMSATSMLDIRRIISEVNKKDAEKLVEQVIDCETEAEVKKLIHAFLKAKKIEIL